MSCSKCDAISGALIDVAFGWSRRFERRSSDEPPEKVCDEHLPLLVGISSIGSLAQWLSLALTAKSGAAWRPCSFCEAVAAVERGDLDSREPIEPCARHGRVSGESQTELQRRLLAISESRGDASADPRSVLRAALVLYASYRATPAYIPRIL